MTEPSRAYPGGRFGDVNYALLEAGKVRLLGLISETRSTEYPGTPILKELGYDFPTPWILDVVGPKGLPDEIARKLEEAFTKAMREPAFLRGMKELHYSFFYRNSKEMTDYIMHDYQLFPKILKQLGLIK